MKPININGVDHATVNGGSQPSNVVAAADGTQYAQTINPGGTI